MPGMPALLHPRLAAGVAVQEADRERIIAEGLTYARRIAFAARVRALTAYRQGGGPVDVIGAAMEALRPLSVVMRRTMLAAHLRGVERVRLSAEAHTRAVLSRRFALAKVKKPPPQTAHEGAIAFILAKGYLRKEDLVSLEAAYGEEALKVIGRVNRKAEQVLGEAMATSLREGEGVAAGTARLREAFKAAGLGDRSPHVLEAEWRTRTQLAYGAGRMQTLTGDPDVAPMLWGFEYTTVGDDRVRPAHAAMDGVRRPKDDPIWARWTPPNGWQCRCSLLEVWNADAADLRTPSDPQPVEGAEPVPDKGFAFNPADVYGLYLKAKLPKPAVTPPPPVAPPAPPAAEPEPPRATRTRRARRKGAPGPLEEPTPAEQPPALPPPPPREWPEEAEIDTLKVVRRLGGSTGAELVEDAYGVQYVRKAGASPGHLREEFAAEEAYRLLGVAVPPSRLYARGGAPVKLSRYIAEARTYGQVKAAGGAEYARVRGEVAAGFPADALLSNWDVVGLDGDNILVDKAGTAWRVDVGGSLRYRAQGGDKGSAWGTYPGELWSLRDPRVNPQTAEAFAGVRPGSLLATAAAAHDRKDALLALLPPEIRSTMEARIGNLRSFARPAAQMQDDGWSDRYVWAWGQDLLQIREQPFMALNPRSLTPTGTFGGELKDETGKPWDHLRDADAASSASAGFYSWLDANRSGPVGNLRGLPTPDRAAAEWAAGQAGSSWSGEAVAVRWYIDRQFGEARYWASGYYRDKSDRFNAARRSAVGYANNTATEEQVEEAIGRWFRPLHAFSYLQAAEHTDLPHVDRDALTVRLIRTVNATDELKPHGIKTGDRNVDAPRGSAESFSLLSPVHVNGTTVTVSSMPLTRVIAGYWNARPGRQFQAGSSWSAGFFASDSENEVVAVADRVRIDVLGNTSGVGPWGTPAPGQKPETKPYPMPSLSAAGVPIGMAKPTPSGYVAPGKALKTTFLQAKIQDAVAASFLQPAYLNLLILPQTNPGTGTAWGQSTAAYNAFKALTGFTGSLADYKALVNL
jgi:SPP1 gp7 family putative phage head morphogenesis protein